MSTFTLILHLFCDVIAASHVYSQLLLACHVKESVRIPWLIIFSLLWSKMEILSFFSSKVTIYSITYLFLFTVNVHTFQEICSKLCSCSILIVLPFIVPKIWQLFLVAFIICYFNVFLLFTSLHHFLSVSFVAHCMSLSYAIIICILMRVL